MFFSYGSDRKLLASSYGVAELSISVVLEMHGVFSRYYENADLQTFIRDINKKTGVIIIRERKGRRIVGFTSWSHMHIDFEGEESIGVFSGDTILEEMYWGDKLLQVSLAKQVLKIKLKNIGIPVYWLLISKGYKTYLLLANNFTSYYPRDIGSPKKLESLVEHYCTELYLDYYCRDRKLLDFGREYQHLKGGVAEINEEMLKGNANISFFEELNPTWRDGTELPCIGEVSLDIIWKYLVNNALPFSKVRKKRLSRAKVVL